VGEAFDGVVRVGALPDLQALTARLTEKPTPHLD
jgi:hypothetical protein